MIIRDTLITKQEESYDTSFSLLSQEQQDSPLIMSKVNLFPHLFFETTFGIRGSETLGRKNIILRIFL